MRILILAALVLASCGTEPKKAPPLSRPHTLVKSDGMAGGKCEPCHERKHVPCDLEQIDKTCVDFDELPDLEGRPVEGLPPGCPKIPTLSALAPPELPAAWGMSPKKD